MPGLFVGVFLAACFGLVAWRAKDVVQVMKWISSLSRPEVSEGYDSPLVLWFLRIIGALGGAIGVTLAVSAALG